MSYASLAEARAEGITTGQASDVRLQALLDAASEFIDDRTGWWFDARAKTLRLDGTGAEHLHLPAPIVSLSSVSIDNTVLTLTADTGDVIQYGALTDPQAERLNPKLVRRVQSGALLGARSYGYGDWRLPARTMLPWPKGRKNITVAGSFGMTASNGTDPPREIKELCLRLAVRSLALLTNAAGQADRRTGEVVKETTDGHAYELAGGHAGTAGAWRRNGWTGDPDIDTILMRWSAPIAGGVV